MERITRVDLEQRAKVGPITKDQAIWEESENMTSERKKLGCARVTMQTLPNSLDQKQAWMLGEKYAELITTAEIFHAKLVDVGKDNPKELEK